MTKINLKLLGALGMLLLSVTMIVVGTFAWFTIGTEATAAITLTFDPDKYPFEVSVDYDPENPEDPDTVWAKELNVSALLANMNADPADETQTAADMAAAPLRPVSTADLVNWYSASYDASGNVRGFSLESLDAIANQPRVTRFDSNLGKNVDMGNNHLIYFDMWVRAMNEDETYGLKLQTAKANDDGTYGDKMVDETVYGTYVLEAPIWDATANDGKGGYVFLHSDAGSALNSARIGFAAMNDDGTIENWFIYEPNADQHESSVGAGAGEADGEAIYRLYEHYEDEDDPGTHVKGYAPASTGETADTYVPTPDGSEYTMTRQPTIRQAHSSWNTEAIAELDEGELDSRCIAQLGQFLFGEGQSEADLVLTDITYGTPKRIRVFIWIEGQDVDCWNQIMGGAIFANFEFTGVAPAEEPAPATEPGS